VIWVAAQNGHRLGFASVWTNDNFLHNLFVDPQYQSMGVGHELLNTYRNVYQYGFA
jgi:GNAT superfamily N-acetyltransferase